VFCEELAALQHREDIIQSKFASRLRQSCSPACSGYRLGEAGFDQRADPISDMEAGQASRTPVVEQAPAAREQPAEADGARLGEQPLAADEAPQPLLARGHEPPAMGEVR
jgi:hypothetical protein